PTSRCIRKFSTTRLFKVGASISTIWRGAWGFVKHLEKVACGAFSDIGFVSGGKKLVFAACPPRHSFEGFHVHRLPEVRAHAGRHGGGPPGSQGIGGVGTMLDGLKGVDRAQGRGAAGRGGRGAGSPGSGSGRDRSGGGACGRRKKGSESRRAGRERA